MKNKRNYGIDLLRSFSMCMVITLHFLGHGGVLQNVNNGANYGIAWLMEAITYAAVDIFATISGFVGWSPEEKRNRAKNFIQLWMQVSFYSLVISIITYLFHNEIGVIGILRGLFPIANDTYWYFTAFFLLTLLMPALNRLITKSENANVWVAIVSFGILMYLSLALTGLRNLSILMFCYVVGGVIRKYDVATKISSCKVVLVIAALIVITWLWKLVVGGYNETLASLSLRYDSPTVICIAVGCVILFARMEIGSSFHKIIEFFGSSAFAAYLLNDHPYIREYIITGRFAFLAYQPVVILVTTVVFGSIAYFIVSIIIDKLRATLFRLMHSGNVAEWIVRKYKSLSAWAGMLVVKGAKKLLSVSRTE